MSLKAFHIVFVALSILLSFFSGVWLLHEFAAEHDTALLAAAILAFAGGGALICYGRSVLRKLKHMSYL